MKEQLRGFKTRPTMISRRILHLRTYRCQARFTPPYSHPIQNLSTFGAVEPQSCRKVPSCPSTIVMSDR